MSPSSPRSERMDVDGPTLNPSAPPYTPLVVAVEASFPNCPLAETSTEWLQDEGLIGQSSQAVEVLEDLYRQAPAIWATFQDDTSRPPGSSVREALARLLESRLTGKPRQQGLTSPKTPRQRRTQQQSAAKQLEPPRMPRRSPRGRARPVGPQDADSIAKSRTKRVLSMVPWHHPDRLWDQGTTQPSPGQKPRGRAP